MFDFQPKPKGVYWGGIGWAEYRYGFQGRRRTFLPPKHSEGKLPKHVRRIKARNERKRQRKHRRRYGH